MACTINEGLAYIITLYTLTSLIRIYNILTSYISITTNKTKFVVSSNKNVDQVSASKIILKISESRKEMKFLNTHFTEGTVDLP